MEKFVLFGLVAALAASVYALDDIALPSDGSFYDGNIETQAFENITASGNIVATGSITANGGLTGTHTNYNCAAATIGAATIQTNATVGGTLGVTGVATFTATPVCSGNLKVTGAITSATAAVTGAAAVGTTLSVGTTATAADLVATNSVDTQSLVVDVSAAVGTTLSVGTTATAADLVATNSIDTQSLVVDTTATLTGVATFTAIPKLTEVQAADTATGISAVLTNLPAAATADAAYFKVTVGETTYAVPMFALP